MNQYQQTQQLQGWTVPDANSSLHRYHPYTSLMASAYSHVPLTFDPLSIYYGGQATHQGYMTSYTDATTQATTGHVDYNQAIAPLFTPVLTNTDNAVTASAYLANDTKVTNNSEVPTMMDPKSTVGNENSN